MPRTAISGLVCTTFLLLLGLLLTLGHLDNRIRALPTH